MTTISESNEHAFVPHSISLRASVAELGEAIASHSSRNGGVLMVTDLPPLPLSALQALFTLLHQKPELGQRLNAAYANNLVYKDSFCAGNGGPAVDMKRVLDLSPERLAQILEQIPSLADELGEPLQTMLSFWKSCTEAAGAKLSQALAHAIGSPDVLLDAHYNFRMVDYYERCGVGGTPLRRAP